MTRVGIVGGGTAGIEAAREVIRSGAEATVFESSTEPSTPFRNWPGLIGGKEPTQSTKESDCEWTTLHSEAKVAGRRFVVDDAGNRMSFDSVVVAAGCALRRDPIVGERKPGVFVLDGETKYAELGRLRESSCIVVQGEGVLGLGVADRLWAPGREIRLLTTHWENGEPSAEVRPVILEAAAERGISISAGMVSRALGTERLEAVISGGAVLPCDTLVVLPRRVPRPLQTDARLGRRGGLLVDGYLSTSLEGMLAAGGCAEVSSIGGDSRPLCNEPGITGRLAGANSLGRRLALCPVHMESVVSLGVRWTRVGPRVGAWSPAGGSASVVGRRFGQQSACSLHFDPTGGLVTGIDLVEEAAAPAPATASLAGPVSLRTLAYLGTSDISMISETAMQGLRAWSKS